MAPSKLGATSSSQQTHSNENNGRTGPLQRLKHGFSSIFRASNEDSAQVSRTAEQVASASVSQPVPPQPLVPQVTKLVVSDIPPLLGPCCTKDEGKPTLVLDVDETLVHSSFVFEPCAPPEDFRVSLALDGCSSTVYVRKRPYVDEFLREISKSYELVVFTASMSLYADPLLDMLDRQGLIAARLFRQHCVYFQGNFIKDLSRLGRPLERILILDNSAVSFLFQPENGVACTSWFSDPLDTELRDLIPFLTYISTKPDLRAAFAAAIAGTDTAAPSTPQIASVHKAALQALKPFVRAASPHLQHTSQLLAYGSQEPSDEFGVATQARQQTPAVLGSVFMSLRGTSVRFTLLDGCQFALEINYGATRLLVGLSFRLSPTQASAERLSLKIINNSLTSNDSEYNSALSLATSVLRRSGWIPALNQSLLEIPPICLDERETIDIYWYCDTCVIVLSDDGSILPTILLGLCAAWSCATIPSHKLSHDQLSIIYDPSANIPPLLSKSLAAVAAIDSAYAPYSNYDDLLFTPQKQVQTIPGTSAPVVIGADDLEVQLTRYQAIADSSGKIYYAEGFGQDYSDEMVKKTARAAQAEAAHFDKCIQKLHSESQQLTEIMLRED